MNPVARRLGGAHVSVAETATASSADVGDNATYRVPFGVELSIRSVTSQGPALLPTPFWVYAWCRSTKAWCFRRPVYVIIFLFFFLFV